MSFRQLRRSPFHPLKTSLAPRFPARMHPKTGMIFVVKPGFLLTTEYVVGSTLSKLSRNLHFFTLKIVILAVESRFLYLLTGAHITSVGSTNIPVKVDPRLVLVCQDQMVPNDWLLQPAWGAILP